MLGECRLVAVDARRRRLDDAPHVRLARGDEERVRPPERDVEALERLGDRAGDRGERRLVEDHVHAGARLLAGAEVADVPLDELDPVVEGREVLALPGLERVEDADGRSLRDEVFDEVGADEAGTTCHEHSVHVGAV